jgi:hypothetical protein
MLLEKQVAAAMSLPLAETAQDRADVMDASPRLVMLPPDRLLASIAGASIG